MPSSASVRTRPAAIAAAFATCLSPCAAGVGELVFLGDFEDGLSVQWVRQNTDFAAGASVLLQPAIVTATKLTNSNTKLTLFLQVPQNLASAPYPAYAAIETFGDAVGPAPAIGDCVRASGTVASFKGATQLSPMTWTAATALDCGNGVITPVFVSLSDIATDSTSATPGNQPGASAEAYENVLLTMNNTQALTSPSNGVFEIFAALGPSETYLFVDDFLYQSGAVVGAHFSAITGVLEEFDSATDPVYQLLPRGAADIVVGP